MPSILHLSSSDFSAFPPVRVLSFEWTASWTPARSTCSCPISGSHREKPYKTVFSPFIDRFRPFFRSGRIENRPKNQASDRFRRPRGR
jgi:hypothetical protein